MKQQATRHPAARFWNRIARKYAGRPVEDETAYRRKLDQTAALLHPDMRVLEYGCGTGTTPGPAPERARLRSSSSRSRPRSSGCVPIG